VVGFRRLPSHLPSGIRHPKWNEAKPIERRTDLTKTNLAPTIKFQGRARQALGHQLDGLGGKPELRGRA